MAVAQAQQVRDLASTAAALAGLMVEDVRLSPAGRRTVVRVTLDLPDDEVGGVPVDAIATASRELSRALDDSDVMGASPYVLEVSSPGVDRPLTERRHFQRARGRLVTVVQSTGAEVRGRLTEVDDEGVVISDQRLPWPTVGRGRVEVEFRHAEAEADDGEDVDDEPTGVDPDSDAGEGRD